jgi:hypothetical protein
MSTGDGRFYPKGFIGSESAILLIAKTRDPSRWTDDTISSIERAVWDGLGTTLNAEFIGDHLRVLSKHQRQLTGDTSMIHRLCDFSEAHIDLRKALFAGEIVAYFLEENGKLNFIMKDGWGGDDGADILLRGVADLVDCWRRVILFSSDDIKRLAPSLPPAWVEESGQAAKGGHINRAVKRPAVEKRRFFEEWRAALDGRVPTTAEDIAAMKEKGINREDARELRKAHPRLPRGKPRAPK